jgi:hypothetical protein
MTFTQQTERYVKKDSFLVVLDSRNAEEYMNGSQHSNVVFDVKYPIQIPKDCIYMTWVVSSFTCPVSWYLINSTNDVLRYLINGNIFSTQFPHGNYNVKTFMSQFLSQMPSGFTIVLESVTNKFTIGYTQSFTLLSDSTIMPVLGGDSNSSYVSSNNVVPMPYPCNFAGLNSFNIKCNNIRTDNLDSYDKCSTSPIIASIPVNASQNGVIYYEKRNDFEFEVKASCIESLDISIEDDLGNNIDLNNQHWNLTLQVNYIREIEKDVNSSFHSILNNYGYNI